MNMFLFIKGPIQISLRNQNNVYRKSCISEKLIIHMMFHAKLYFNVWNINYYQLSILKKFYVLLKKTVKDQ